ncbi:hypothetical protein BJX70DRAFT_99983 [Aspergillus crustosus]
MSSQPPLRRWAIRPLNLRTMASFNLAPPIMRFPTWRPFSLARQTRTRAPPLRKVQSQTQSHFENLLCARRAFHSSRTRCNGKSSYTYQPPTPSPSLSQRLKTLSREYGWSALWIYLFLSALDFPFCFAAVKLLGADKIGHYEHVVVEGVTGAVNKVWPGAFERSGEEEEEEEEAVADQAVEKKKGPAEEASLWTQLALAYAIHKSFIFFRVPLTAAITPKVVKQLRKWGWDVLKGKPKAR